MSRTSFIRDGSEKGTSKSLMNSQITREHNTSTRSFNESDLKVFKKIKFRNRMNYSKNHN
jgi:hypothetical protein